MADSSTAGLPPEIRRYDVVVRVVYVDEHGAHHEDEVACMDEVTEAAKDLLVQRLNLEMGNFVEFMAEQQRWDFNPVMPPDGFHQPALYGYDIAVWGDFEMVL